MTGELDPRNYQRYVGAPMTSDKRIYRKLEIGTAVSDLRRRTPDNSPERQAQRDDWQPVTYPTASAYDEAQLAIIAAKDNGYELTPKFTMEFHLGQSSRDPENIQVLDGFTRRVLYLTGIPFGVQDTKGDLRPSFPDGQEWPLHERRSWPNRP